MKIKKILKDNGYTLKDLITFLVVDSDMLKPTLEDMGIEITEEEKHDLKDELYKMIQKY